MELLNLPAKKQSPSQAPAGSALQGICMMANPNSSLSHWGWGEAADPSNVFNMNLTFLTLLSFPTSQTQQEEHRQQALPEMGNGAALGPRFILESLAMSVLPKK